MTASVSFYRVNGFGRPPEALGTVSVGPTGSAVIPEGLRGLIRSARVQDASGRPVPPTAGHAYLAALCRTFSGSYLWARPDTPPQVGPIQTKAWEEEKHPRGQHGRFAPSRAPLSEQTHAELRADARALHREGDHAGARQREEELVARGVIDKTSSAAFDPASNETFRALAGQSQGPGSHEIQDELSRRGVVLLAPSMSQAQVREMRRRAVQDGATAATLAAEHGISEDHAHDILSHAVLREGAVAPGAKATIHQAREIRARAHAEGLSQAALAGEYHLTTKQIWHILHHTTHKEPGGTTGSAEKVVHAGAAAPIVPSAAHASIKKVTPTPPPAGEPMTPEHIASSATYASRRKVFDRSAPEQTRGQLEEHMHNARSALAAIQHDAAGQPDPLHHMVPTSVLGHPAYGGAHALAAHEVAGASPQQLADRVQNGFNMLKHDLGAEATAQAHAKIVTALDALASQHGAYLGTDFQPHPAGSDLEARTHAHASYDSARAEAVRRGYIVDAAGHLVVPAGGPTYPSMRQAAAHWHELTPAHHEDLIGRRVDAIVASVKATKADPIAHPAQHFQELPSAASTRGQTGYARAHAFADHIGATVILTAKDSKEAKNLQKLKAAGYAQPWNKKIVINGKYASSPRVSHVAWHELAHLMEPNDYAKQTYGTVKRSRAQAERRVDVVAGLMDEYFGLGGFHRASTVGYIAHHYSDKTWKGFDDADRQWIMNTVSAMIAHGDHQASEAK